MGTSGRLRLLTPALMLLPGAIVVYTGFNAGGFFPDTPAFVAIVLLQVLILRVILADRPFEGMSRELAIAVGLLGLFALWALASALWSNAPARALLEFDRVLLYLVALLLFGSFAADRQRQRWLMWGLAAGFCAVCVPGLISRIRPDIWEPTANLASNRLSYPVTYWNALGIMAGLGIILCFHLASSARGPAVPRMLGAAAVPALATALYFTFSRGAILATIIGVIAYVAIARPRGIYSALGATVPATAIAVAVAYKADVLATETPAIPKGIEQGERVAIAVVLCMLAAAAVRLLALPLDTRLARLGHVVAPRMARISVAGTVAVALLVFLALGGPGWIGDQYDRFAEGSGETGTADLRNRLTDPGNNGRIDHWRVAREAFAENRLLGRGAGTYQLSWEQDRDLIFPVVDGHGLYFEVAGELGLVGLALLAGTILTLLAGLARRARGADRSAYGALLAAGIAWAVHAGIDWDWEMPATTFWFFAAAGAAVAAPLDRDHESGPLRATWRTPIALALAVVAVTPALVTLSHNRIQAAADAFAIGDCRAAIDKSLDATSVLAARPEPYAMIGYCQARAGFGRQGVRAMEEAVERDPGNWEYRYGLAVARGVAGLDPRGAAAAALARNPGEPIVRDARQRFQSGGPRTWPASAEKARKAIFESGLISLP